MARLFDDGSNQFLRIRDTGGSFDTPISMACWFYSDNITIHQTLIGAYYYDGVTSGYEHHRLLIRGAEGGDPVAAGTQTVAAGYTDAITSTGYSANTWHHAAGVWASPTSRAAYIDGGSKGTDATSKTPAGTPDSLIIGLIEGSNGSGQSQYMSGRIAEVAIWDVALTDAEVAILALGYSPLLIRPQSLVAYWPLIGRTSPEIDIVGGYDMALNNGPTTVAHPRVLYPSRPHILLPSDVAPPVVAAYRRRIFVVG